MGEGKSTDCPNLAQYTDRALMAEIRPDHTYLPELLVELNQRDLADTSVDIHFYDKVVDTIEPDQTPPDIYTEAVDGRYELLEPRMHATWEIDGEQYSETVSVSADSAYHIDNYESDFGGEGLTRRDVVKSFAGLGAAVATSSIWGRESARSAALNEVKDIVGALDLIHAKDLAPKQIYLGNVNTYNTDGKTYRPTNPVPNISTDGSVDIDLVWPKDDSAPDTVTELGRNELRNLAQYFDRYTGLGLDNRLRQYLSKVNRSLTLLADDDHDFDVNTAVHERGPRYLEEAIAPRIEEEFTRLLDEADVTVDVVEYDGTKDDIIDAYTEKERYPVFMTTNSLEGIGGYATHGAEVANANVYFSPFAVLEPDEILDDQLGGAGSGLAASLIERRRSGISDTVLHELGHGIVGLPHNAHPDSIMSYNIIGKLGSNLLGQDQEFTDYDQMYIDRMLEGTITERDDGTAHIDPAPVPPQTADPAAIDNLQEFLHVFTMADPPTPDSYSTTEDEYRLRWDTRDGYIAADITAPDFISELSVQEYLDRKGTEEELYTVSWDT